MMVNPRAALREDLGHLLGVDRAIVVESERVSG